MIVGFSSFANSFQSAQASHSQSTNKVATASIASNASVAKKFCGTVVSPNKTAIRDAYTRSPATNTLTARNTYSSPTFPLQTLATTSVADTTGLNVESTSSKSDWLTSRMSRPPWDATLNNERAWAFGSELASFFSLNKQQRWDRMGWHFAENGHWFQGRATALPHTDRSEKIAVQARQEATGHILNQQIDHALKASGISLAEKERLNFSIDHCGTISVTGGLSDADGRKQALESMLNSDDAIRSNLFLYQVQQNRMEKVHLTASESTTENLMITLAYGWANGNISGVQEGIRLTGFSVDDTQWEEVYRFKGFPIEFSFQDGKVFQGETFPEDRVFSNRLDSLADLGKIIGLDDTAAEDVQSFITALEQNIAVDASKLTGLLNAALKQAKLGNVQNKITFAQDAEGNIVVEGNISEKQKERLAKIINDDPELSELIKTQSAKQAVLDELKASITDEPAFINSQSAWNKHNARPAGFNLAQDSLAAAREQLLKNFLDRSGVSLSDLSMSDLEGNLDAVFSKHGELGAIKGLRNEIANLLTSKAQQATKPPATETQPLLAMKRGELVETAEANERLSIDEGVSDLKTRLNHWMEVYNKFIACEMPGQPELMLTGYTVTFDHNGNPSLEVRRANGDSASGTSEQFEVSAPGVPTELMNVFTYKPGAYQDLALAILDAHDDEHGDVQEYNHSVVIDSGFGQYRIESPDADAAALQEMKDLTQEIGTSLGEFFVEIMNIENPFALMFGSDGLLSFNADSLPTFEAQAVQKVLDEINAYLTADKVDENTEDMLSEELVGIADKLFALKEVPKKFHDQSLVPKGGVVFGVNGQ